MLRCAPLPAHEHEHVHATTPSNTHDHHHHHHPRPSSLPEEPNAAAAARPLSLLDEPTLTASLSQLPKESVYRVKGFIRFGFAHTSPSTPTPTPVPADADAESRPWWILNWAFGRWELVRAPSCPVVDENDGDKHAVVRLTVMGERGEVRRYAERLAEALGATVV